MKKQLFTSEECLQILKAKEFKALQLTDYEIIPITGAHGFLGDYHRLVLHCKKANTAEDEDDSTKLIFFMKSFPLKSTETQITAIFQKEAKLYATLLKDLQSYSTTLWCPKLYYKRTDLLVLQDMCNLGYEKCQNAGKHLSDEELKAILKTVAAFHACSFVLEERIGCNIDAHYPSDIFGEFSISTACAWYTTSLKTLLELAKQHPAYQLVDFKNLIDNKLETCLKSVYEMVEPSKKYRNVLCHRDAWHANVLFNYTNMSAVLVDFQTCRYAPPSMDVIFVIFMHRSRKQRNAFESSYLLWYYEALKLELSQNDIDIEDCLPFEELRAAYEDFRLFALVYRFIVITFTEVPVEFITNHFKYVERTEKLLNYMKSNESFRHNVEESISEILDYLTKERT